MTEETQGVAGFDTSLLDPNAWKEPFELIPVKIVKAAFRWSSADYNAATKFRPAFPRPIQQFVLDLERYDAQIALLDGSVVPAIIHAGVDLEGFNREQTEIRGLMQGRGKAQLVISSWVDKAGSLVPDPSRIEGQNWMIKRYAQKKLGGSGENTRYAQNVVVPDSILAPDYVYTGKVQTFQQKRKVEDENGTVNTANVAAAPTLSPEAAAQEISQFIASNGITDIGPEILGHPNFPVNARVEPLLTAIAQGEGREALAAFGATV